jgi:hypothetical protein
MPELTPLQRATRNHVIEVANRLRAKHGLPPWPTHERRVMVWPKNETLPQ